MGNNLEWWDYENQKALRLPPVGEKVEMHRQGEDFFEGELLFAGKELLVVLHQKTEISLRHYHVEFRPLDHATRKAELEKKQVVDAARSEVYISRCLLELLYDAGYLRLPTNKD